MRDIAIAVIVFGSLPYIIKKPYVGVFMWVWISVMNPHTQGWGFATTFPFAAIIAVTLMLSVIITKDPKDLPFTPVTLTLFAFILWMNVSSLFALQPQLLSEHWSKVMKIMLMIIVPLMAIKTKQHIQLLIWLLVVSVGFYGVKGGIFTLLTGGQHRVWGPATTFIEGNNEIALALVVIIPLIHYLQIITANRWARHGLTIAMLFCALASLGSYSRGALLAIIAMGAFLWLKSKHKLGIGLLLLAIVPMLVAFMPDKWGDRMDTISTYQADSSAMGRINAWQMAINLANDRPLVGGGFEIYNPQTFQRYAPNPTAIHAAHSIYFQALGEHGYVGLSLYLLLGFLTWRTGALIVRSASGVKELKWASDLARMLQVSFVGFGVGGAFLSLLYFDVPYYLMVAMVATHVLIRRELKARSSPAVLGATKSFDPLSTLESGPASVRQPIK